MNRIFIFLCVFLLPLYILSQTDTKTAYSDTSKTGISVDSMRRDTLKETRYDSLGQVVVNQTDSIKEEKISLDFEALRKDTSFLVDLLPLDSLSIIRMFYQKPPRVWNIDTLPGAKDFLREQFLQDSLSGVSDTLKQQIGRLIHYVSAIPTEPLLLNIEETMKDTTYRFIPDSTQDELNDSLYIAVNNLLNYAQTDSFKVCLVNSRKEQNCIWLNNKPSQDSFRLRLYDNNGVPAMVWIDKQSKQNIQLMLDEGTIVQKPESKTKLKGYIPVEQIKSSDLQKPSNVNIILGRWILEGESSIQFNQGYYSNSWVGGGENTIASISSLHFSADYEEGPMNWDNDLDIQYGLLATGEKSLRKTEDRLELNSQFGKSAFKDWYFTSMLNLKSQVTRGYDYPNDSIPISDFLAPGSMVFSVGLDRKPSKDFTLLLSPLTAKFTYMRDTVNFDQTTYGIQLDEKLKKEVGAYLKTRHNWKINDDIVIENKLNLFTNYFGSSFEEHSQGFFKRVRSNVDIDWEMNIDFRISYYINASINTHLIYDYEVKDKLQFKELINIGFSYQF